MHTSPLLPVHATVCICVLYTTIHDCTRCSAVRLLLRSVPSAGRQIQTTVKSFHLTNRNNGATSVALGKHRHWLCAPPAFQGLSLIREIWQCFLQAGPGGWHKWDYQRNTKQMRGAPASVVPLLGDHARRRTIRLRRYFGKRQSVLAQVWLWWSTAKNRMQHLRFMSNEIEGF